MALEAGGEDDLEGTVSFEAKFGVCGQHKVMTEMSLFQRMKSHLKGDWLYVKAL